MWFIAANQRKSKACLPALQRLSWLTLLVRAQFAATSPPTCILNCSQNCCKHILSGAVPYLCLDPHSWGDQMEREQCVTCIRLISRTWKCSAQPTHSSLCPEKPLYIFLGPDKMLGGETESPELLLLLGLGFFFAGCTGAMQDVFVTEDWRR